jgi:hypothetical protein
MAGRFARPERTVVFARVSWLAGGLTAKGTGYTIADNAFILLDDWTRAQAPSSPAEYRREMWWEWCGEPLVADAICLIVACPAGRMPLPPPEMLA